MYNENEWCANQAYLANFQPLQASGQWFCRPAKERELLYVILFRLNFLCDPFTTELGAEKIQVRVGPALPAVLMSSLWHSGSHLQKEDSQIVVKALNDERFSFSWPVLRCTMLRLQDLKGICLLKWVQRSSDMLIFHLESKPPKKPEPNKQKTTEIGTILQLPQMNIFYPVWGRWPETHTW